MLGGCGEIEQRVPLDRRIEREATSVRAALVHGVSEGAWRRGHDVGLDREQPAARARGHFSVGLRSVRERRSHMPKLHRSRRSGRGGPRSGR